MDVVSLCSLARQDEGMDGMLILLRGWAARTRLSFVAVAEWCVYPPSIHAVDARRVGLQRRTSGDAEEVVAWKHVWQGRRAPQGSETVADRPFTGREFPSLHQLSAVHTDPGQALQAR